MGNVTKIPDAAVVLDLDSYERPEEEVKPPFVVTVGGKEVTFADPSDIDWRELAAFEIPGDLLRSALSREDHRHLTGLALPGFKFNKLMAAYYDHYDLEDKIRQAKQQQRLHSV